MLPKRGVVVTGAGSGMGAALAVDLARRGAHVVAVDRSGERLEEVVSSEPRIRAHPMDVTDRRAFADLLRSVDDDLQLDGLFNIAGVGATRPFLGTTEQEWDRVLEVNLRAVIVGTSTALELMGERRRGVIVNMASVSGLVPVPMQTVYNTSKYAVVGLSRSLRPEAATMGVQVNVVCPGNVATGIWGQPIIGEAVAATPPANAVAGDEAARLILRGVRRNRPVIVFPRSSRRLVRTERLLPRRSARRMRHMYDERRHR